MAVDFIECSTAFWIAISNCVFGITRYLGPLLTKGNLTSFSSFPSVVIMVELLQVLRSRVLESDFQDQPVVTQLESWLLLLLLITLLAVKLSSRSSPARLSHNVLHHLCIFHHLRTAPLSLSHPSTHLKVDYGSLSAVSIYGKDWVLPNGTIFFAICALR